MSLVKDLAVSIAKKKLKKIILAKVLLPVLGFSLSAILIITIPMMILEGIKQTFSNWFDGKEVNYSDVGTAVEAWLDTVDDGITFGDEYVSKQGIKSYIAAERGTFLKDYKLTIEEIIDTTKEDTYSPEKKIPSRTTNKTKYDLLLENATKEYRLPWQIMTVKNAVLNKGYSDDIRDQIVNLFSPKFYGLFNNDETTPVTVDIIKNNINYRHYKTVKTTTETVKEYYLQTINKNKELVRLGPYYNTTTQISNIQYPLPYFTKIETMTGTIYFEYETKTQTTETTKVSQDGLTNTTITTIITEPVLKKKDSELDSYKYIRNINALGLQPQDIEYINELVKALPGGEEVSNTYYDISSLMSIMNNYDIYYGAEAWGASFKLSGKGILAWPVDSSVNITSGFGMRLHPLKKVYKLHTGIDISAAMGKKVLAAADGVVQYTGLDPDGYGNYIILAHPDGMSTYYAHLSSILVSKGKTVRCNDLIGLVGSTGASTGPHLHFETRIDEVPYDPSQYLGLIPIIPDVLPDELKYKEVDKEKLRQWLINKNSYIANEPWLSDILEASKQYDINPYLMMAITGQEMSFVKDDYKYWGQVYGEDSLLRKLKNISSKFELKDAPKCIANNPYNVKHSWWEYNTNLKDAAGLAARTIIKLSKDRPEDYHPIAWINRVNDPSYGYAEDKNWWVGVCRFYDILKTQTGYKN